MTFIPDTVNGVPVYAFIRDPHDSQLAFVICRQPVLNDRYVVWTLYNESQNASNGHYDLPWLKALAVLMKRAENI